MKNISIKSILKELYEQEETTTDPQVEFPEWLENKLRTVHGEPGQGSIFADPNSVKDAVLDVIEQNKDRIAEVASTTGTIKTDVSGIGYDLVIPTEEARQLADAVMGETEKVEGPNRFRVPMVRTSAPLSDFATDQLTVVVRPKKDQSGAVIPNQYIILSAFPGKDLPRTSEWNGKYAVVVPEQSESGLKENLKLQKYMKRRKNISLKVLFESVGRVAYEPGSIFHPHGPPGVGVPGVWASPTEGWGPPPRYTDEQIRREQEANRQMWQDHLARYNNAEGARIAKTNPFSSSFDENDPIIKKIASTLERMRNPENQDEKQQKRLNDILYDNIYSIPSYKAVRDRQASLEKSINAYERQWGSRAESVYDTTNRNPIVTSLDGGTSIVRLETWADIMDAQKELDKQEKGFWDAIIERLGGLNTTASEENREETSSSPSASPPASSSSVSTSSTDTAKSSSSTSSTSPAASTTDTDSDYEEQLRAAGMISESIDPKRWQKLAKIIKD